MYMEFQAWACVPSVNLRFSQSAVEGCTLLTKHTAYTTYRRSLMIGGMNHAKRRVA